MEWIYRAREEGKYRALGGHKATLDYYRAGQTGMRCTECGRRVTESNAGVRHAPQRKGKKA